MEPRFEPLSSTSGVTILDPIEKRRFSLLTPTPVSPKPATIEEFYFPVSVARSIRTSEIELPYKISVYVRDTEGTMLADVEPSTETTFPRDEYLIELSSPVKLYLRVESELDVYADTKTVRLSFGDKTTVRVGARSPHKSPAGTVTVSDDPEGTMAGLSALSSSLKTTSPERSFPTLRGHPPRIERGESVAVPDGLARPETGVTIELPPEYEFLYPVAPLAFYLGAEVVSGDVPRLRTDAGFEHRLDSRRGYEQEVERVLKQTFFLDCVVRTEGYYPIELAERNAVEDRLSFDFETVYDRPLAERIETYLDVAYPVIEDAVPTWHRVTFVRPDPENVELLPYVVNDLSLIRTPPSEEPVDVTEEETELWGAVDEFQRSPPEENRALFRGASPDESEKFTRDTSPDEFRAVDREYVTLPETEAIETAWVGDGTPTTGTKLLKAAYEHDRPSPDEGVIDITVVCNDSRMRREWDTVSEIYGTREDIPIEVDIEFGLGTEDLRELLAKPTDFFHYIGHVDDRGFDCIDGSVDAKTLEDAGMKAFLLNACDSFEQGEALIEAGASAGIVSLSEVGNESAMQFGQNLIKLFYHGFTVGTAQSLVSEYTDLGSRYIALGKSELLLTQNKNNTGTFYEILENTGDSISVNVYSYPNQDHPMGSIVHLFLQTGVHHLISDQLKTLMVTKTEFMNEIGEDILPIVVDGEFVWSDEWSQKRIYD